MTVRAADAAEEVHHHLRFTKREVRREDEARMPARRRRLETAVLLVGELEEQHERVRECHERMFPYRRSALDRSAAAALERGQPAELAHVREVAFRAESRGHSREVSDRGHLGAHAAAERFSPGSPSQVVVAPGSGWSRDDLQLAVVGRELEHGLFEHARLERARAR